MIAARLWSLFFVWPYGENRQAEVCHRAWICLLRI